MKICEKCPRGSPMRLRIREVLRVTTTIRYCLSSAREGRASRPLSNLERDETREERERTGGVEVAHLQYGRTS